MNKKQLHKEFISDLESLFKDGYQWESSRRIQAQVTHYYSHKRTHRRLIIEINTEEYSIRDGKKILKSIKLDQT